MIERKIKSAILSKWHDKKVIILTGARQVGKSTLLRQICSEQGDYLFLNGDDPEITNLLKNAGENALKQIIGSYSTVFIDEAQRIDNISIISKIIYDRLPNVKLVLSGSSSFLLQNQLNEPLTGRKWEYNLFAISWQEYANNSGFLASKLALEKRVIFGMYPEIVSHSQDEGALLKQISSSYLYKDILALQQIRKPEILDKLLLALALQIGSEVNYNELSVLLKIDRRTVEDYISLLEKLFVVFRVPALSRNERNEIANSRKIYFYDTGIRNAIIGDFQPMVIRQDVGGLWENFIVSELIKKAAYQNETFRYYFWRTYQQQEVDFIIEQQGKLQAYEIKWNEKAKAKFPQTFTNSYPAAKTQVVNKENFTDILLEDQ